MNNDTTLSKPYLKYEAGKFSARPLGKESIKSGIYQILNTVNNKIYIGSTSNFITRKSRHFIDLRRQQHKNAHLQSSYNKYGEHVFEFTVLEYCEPRDCLVIEQQYLDIIFNSEYFDQSMRYNVHSTAGSSLGFKHTDETRKRMSVSRKGRVLTDDHRRNLSKSASRSVYQLDITTGEVIAEYSSAKEASEALRISRPHITSVCNKSVVVKSSGRTYIRKSAGGFGWCFA